MLWIPKGIHGKRIYPNDNNDRCCIVLEMVIKLC